VKFKTEKLRTLQPRGLITNSRGERLQNPQIRNWN